MRNRAFVSIITCFGLAACVDPSATPNGAPVNLPEAVLEIVGPNQDLSSVRLMADGCYWYSHKGPVETTLLPLRTSAGNPICTAKAEAAA